MPKINRLPKSIYELIAAGEVVERPASVVKELVENSIDAGAKDITVEIQNGGIKYIRITDNGCGISREDVPLAFTSHATSKISSEEDLFSIGTLGFRGEALASISAVSHTEMLTRTNDSNIGTRMTVSGGEFSKCEDAGCPVGTTIVIRDLFYNTPARMKFLKQIVRREWLLRESWIKSHFHIPKYLLDLLKTVSNFYALPETASFIQRYIRYSVKSLPKH